MNDEEARTKTGKGQSLARALLAEPWNCVWREWQDGDHLVVLSRAERLGEEPRGYYLLVECKEMPIPLHLKGVLPDYPALVLFCEHAGVDLLSGWQVSAQASLPHLPDRVRESVYQLSLAPRTAAELGMTMAAASWPLSP